MSTSPSKRGFLELSHVISAGLVTYPGLPAPVITPHLTHENSRSHYSPGTEFAMDIISMIGNTGTYLDSPWHRYEDGTDLAGLDLDALVELPALVIRADPNRRAVIAADLAGRPLEGAAVLLDTGWSRHFGTAAYLTGAPYLARDAVDLLVESGAALVGIDSLNIDDTESGGERPAHSGLLAAGIPIVEHLTNLAAVPDTGALFTATPPRIAGFGTFPVRAFASLKR